MSQQDENKGNSAVEFNKIWDEYKKTLDIWKQTYDSWQKATNDALAMYAQMWKKMVKSDPEPLKKWLTNG